MASNTGSTGESNADERDTDIERLVGVARGLVCRRVLYSYIDEYGIEAHGDISM